MEHRAWGMEEKEFKSAYKNSNLQFPIHRMNLF